MLCRKGTPIGTPESVVNVFSWSDMSSLVIRNQCKARLFTESGSDPVNGFQDRESWN